MPSVQPAIWPLSRLVIFDCDSTLVTVEGIDELARLISDERTISSPQNPHHEDIAIQIASLTKRAMEGELPLETIYGLRLTTINPTQSQVRQIASIYRQAIVSDAVQVISALKNAGILVFIVSGGMIEPVQEFGNWLGISSDRIYAVDIQYDQLSGRWWRYWDQPYGLNTSASYLAHGTGPLTDTKGKNRIIAHIRAENPGRTLLVGDGLTDLEAGEEVDLFIGFGGVKQREIVALQAPVFIKSPFLSPILPLALGQAGNIPYFSNLWADGIRRINAGEVSFRDLEMQTLFFNALRRPGSS